MNENEESCSYMRNKFDYPAFRISMSGMFSVAALVTTVLNSLVLISIWKTPSLHKPSYILIGSLAFSDFLVGAIGEPLMILDHIAVLQGWSLNNFCLIFTCARIVTYALGGISMLTLVFISVDRFLALKLRNRYQSVVTQKRVLLVLVACWILTFICSSALLGHFKLNPVNTKALLVFVGITAFILVITIIVFYSMAFYTLRKITCSSVSPSVQNTGTVPHAGFSTDLIKYRRSLITMFLVFIFTILFYSPLAIVYVVSPLIKFKAGFSSHIISQDIALVCQGAAEFFTLLNSANNPLLCLWRMRDIRVAVNTVFKFSSSP